MSGGEEFYFCRHCFATLPEQCVHYLYMQREKEVVSLRAALKESEKECHEQGRLLGMGAQREAALESRLKEKEAELARAREALKARKCTCGETSPDRLVVHRYGLADMGRS